MPPFDTIYSINHFIIFNQVVFPLYLSPLFSFKLFFRGNLAEISQISIFYQRRHLCTYHGNIYKLICEISVFSWVEVFPFNSGEQWLVARLTISIIFINITENSDQTWVKSFVAEREEKIMMVLMMIIMMLKMKKAKPNHIDWIILL